MLSIDFGERSRVRAPMPRGDHHTDEKLTAAALGEEGTRHATVLAICPVFEIIFFIACSLAVNRPSLST